MSHRERRHREDPVRTEPLRDMSRLYRSADAGKPGETDTSSTTRPGAGQETAWNEVVKRGVDLGYRVVEEYIRQGQHAAQQINTGSYGNGTAGSTPRELIERMGKYYTDLGTLWGDLINSFMANPDVIAGLARLWSPAAAQPLGKTKTDGAVAVALTVVATRPTEVILDLYPGAEGCLLTTHGLRATDADKPALTAVTFTPGRNGDTLRVRVQIPDNQPPDTYTGVVVDKDTNQPRGTLSVRIIQ